MLKKIMLVAALAIASVVSVGAVARSTSASNRPAVTEMWPNDPNCPVYGCATLN